MGAHSTRSTGRNGRAFAIAGRGALTASAAIALVGGGAGMAFAGDAPSSDKSDSGHGDWGHDKGHDKDWGHGDKHDGWGHDKHGKKHDKHGDHPKWDKHKESHGLLGGILGEKPEHKPGEKLEKKDDGKPSEKKDEPTKKIDSTTKESDGSTKKLSGAGS